MGPGRKAQESGGVRIKKGGSCDPPFFVSHRGEAYAAWLTWVGKTSSIRR
jgi:hypothetical protein